MNHDQLVLWADLNADRIAKTVYGESAVVDFKRWEYAVTSRATRGERVEGHVDLAIHALRGKQAAGGGYVFVEAKPKIESVGDLLRQIRRYEVYLNQVHHHLNVRFAVVSNEAQWRTVLEEQGVHFFSPEGQRTLI